MTYTKEGIMFLKHASKNKIWKLAEPHDSNAKELASSLGVTMTTARLLCGRGYDTSESARAFIDKETEMLHDPYLLADMKLAVDRIEKALAGHERIVVYGDYDVDGVTAVTVLYSYLTLRGGDVKYYIPNRVGEGYGVNLEAIRGFASDGYSLLITVDTGITAIDEVLEASKLGLDTVITDHHECRPELPDAVAVINPRRPDCSYPFKELAGCGVAFKLICALEMRLSRASMYDAVKFAADNYCELVSIGTIADVMPLMDENRIIVSYGLRLLEKTKNIGISALMRASGLIQTDAFGKKITKKITSSSIGFTLAPRINAAGRISSATFAVELFLCTDAARADEIATELCETNRKRQLEENGIIAEAESKLLEQCAEDDYVIVLSDDHWHHGVIGIVCSRLTEKYNLPSILISFESQSGNSDGDIGKGSGRSVSGLNLVEALAACEDKLTKYGGHELAAGLSLERGKLEEFRKAINLYAASQLDGRDLSRVISIDCLLDSGEISLRLANELYLLEPFGIANAQPLFETDGMMIKEITALSGGKHTKLTLTSSDARGDYFTALMFGTPTAEFGYRVGDVVDICYNLDINEFRNHQSVQLLIRDIKHANIKKSMPSRDDFASLYIKLKHMQNSGKVVCSTVGLAGDIGFDAQTVDKMLDIFAELSFIEIKRGASTEIVMLPVKGKIALENSTIYTQMLNDHT